jgi:hypothetical protein
MLRPDRILRRQDIGGSVTLSIRGVSLEQLGTRTSDAGWLLHFDGTDKCLLLDPVLIRYLEQAFGADVDLWAGRRVVIWVEDRRIALREARARPRIPLQREFEGNVIPLARRAGALKVNERGVR